MSQKWSLVHTKNYYCIDIYCIMIIQLVSTAMHVNYIVIYLKQDGFWLAANAFIVSTISFFCSVEESYF